MNRRSFFRAVGGVAAGLVGGVVGLAKSKPSSVVYRREQGVPDVMGPGLRQMVADCNRPVTKMKSLDEILQENWGSVTRGLWTAGQPNTIGNLDA